MRTVLVVEDSTWLSDSYARILEAEGYGVITAPDGSAAIDAVDDHSPDIILLDMLLPRMTAMALLHELQSHGDLARIPVVIVTTIAHHVIQNDLAPYGVRKILDKATMKPVDMLVAVEEALGENVTH